MDLSTIHRELNTNDLHLRPIRLSDAEGMFAMLSDKESMKYWCAPPIAEVSDALDVLRKDVESDGRGNSL